MQVKKQQLELDMEQQTGSKLEKDYVKAVYWTPCLFNLYAEYIMWNTRLDEVQAGIKIVRRNISNLSYADDTTLMAETKEIKEPLDKGERGEWKSWLKTQLSKNKDHGIWPHYFMANTWGNNGNSDRLPKSLLMVTAAIKLKDACSLEEKQ